MIEPKRINSLKTSAGFTLIEVAIVVLVVSILVGYTVALIPVQQELKQYRETNDQLDRVADLLIGYAAINGRLPCPDINVTTGSGYTSTIDGREDFSDDLQNDATPFAFDDPATTNTDNNVDGIADGCIAYDGFLPAGTLGISGSIDATTGQLVDPWGQPYRYAITSVNVDANGDGDNGDGDIGIGADFVTPNGIRDEGIPAFAGTPDLFVCSDSTELGVDATCADVTGNELVANLVAVIYSTGKDLGNVASNVQTENTDGDRVFIYSARNEASGSEYDDVVKWISTNELFSRMIDSGRLP